MRFINYFSAKKTPNANFYLAVPSHALDNILSREVERVAIEGLKVNVLVYSLTEEEQLQWKPQ